MSIHRNWQRPAIFCYDLMNEPILPGKEPETEWLAGELGGKFFVQRLALELKDRTREQVAAAWVNTLAEAIPASWLEKFQQMSTDVKAGKLPDTE